MTISLIINTTDPDLLDLLRTEVERLRGEGSTVHPELTFETGDARRFAYSASSNRAELIIIVGGDGTINEVVNGVHDWLDESADANGEAPEPPRLAIVPAGTGNDFAAGLLVPEDPAQALTLAFNGREREVDVGRVDGRCFLNVSTGGVGAEATEETASEVKKVLGPIAYLVTGVRKFVTLDVSSARFVSDGPIYDGRFLIYAVGNARRTGGGNWITPRAELDDQLLDVCIVKEMSRMELLKLLPDLRTGDHLEHPAVLYHQVAHLNVQADHELSVNADGEPLSGTSFNYDISPYRMRIMAGSEAT